MESPSIKLNYENIKKLIDNEISNSNLFNNLYKSADGIIRIVSTIAKTKGDSWASKVLDNEGNQLLTTDEQSKFTDLFQPYINSIINFYNKDVEDKDDDDIEMSGGALPSQSTVSTDSIFSKIIHGVNEVNSKVKNYARSSGLLKLESDYSNIKLPVLPPALSGVASIIGLNSKINIPFRLITFTIYLILDIARLAIATSSDNGRKIMSILLAIVDLLKGDWKRAILSGIGYYGMSPMLIGQSIKAYLSIFRTISPDIQIKMIYGSFDSVKSFVIGILISIFQITASDDIRNKLVPILDSIANNKKKIDNILGNLDLPPRPDYLSPTWDDLNNIQSVITDEGYICSCEFRKLTEIVKTSHILTFIFEMLRLPVSDDMIIHKCGVGKCTNFIPLIVSQAIAEKEKQLGVKSLSMMKTVTPQQPMIQEPPSTPQPMTTQPMTTQPITAQSMTAQSMTTQPMTAQPMTAQGIPVSGVTYSTVPQAFLPQQQSQLQYQPQFQQPQYQQPQYQPQQLQFQQPMTASGIPVSGVNPNTVPQAFLPQQPMIQQPMTAQGIPVSGVNPNTVPLAFSPQQQFQQSQQRGGKSNRRTLRRASHKDAIPKINPSHRECFW